MRELSRQLSDMPASPTIAVTDKAKGLKAAGKDVIALAGGEPDFDTPAHVIDCAIEAMRAGETHYAAPSKGVPVLTEAIAAKMERENNISVNPKSQIVVTPGCKMVD